MEKENNKWEDPIIVVSILMTVFFEIVLMVFSIPIMYHYYIKWDHYWNSTENTKQIEINESH